MGLKKYKIGKLITPIDERNYNGAITRFYGININKEFMPTVADVSDVNPRNYKKVFFECYRSIRIDISKQIKPKFDVLPKRWCVERTFAWMGNSRRLSKDYEVRLSNAEVMCIISNAHTLLRRI